METTPKTAVVTGASGGIGYELCKLLARDGYNVILVARNEQNLEAVAHELKNEYGTSTFIIVQDLSMAMAADQLAERIGELKQPVDILVNNAGFGSYGLFSESNSGTNLDMILTNVVALTRLTQFLLPELISRKGKILNVASLAAMQPVPLFAVYAATKAYVLSFSEALADELQSSGVTVTTLCPGITETCFQKRASMEHAKSVQGRLMSASTVARIGYRGLLRGQRVVVPGTKEKLLAAAVNLAPRRLVTKMARSMMK
ncbi:MAG: SDR family oxidoreductase [Firmicutes bacterium]|nr:SDR family oxidoreductase [Bacillota bacterium]